MLVRGVSMRFVEKRHISYRESGALHAGDEACPGAVRNSYPSQGKAHDGQNYDAPR